MGSSVPLLVALRIAQAKIRRAIDDALGLVGEHVDRLGGFAVRQCEEQHVGAVQSVRMGELEGRRPAQSRVGRIYESP